MSVRNGLLALLTEGPKYGSQLRTEFEERTGKTWPLNIGQVYQTLARLERDGLVLATDFPDDAPAQDLRHYELTAAGRTAARAWFGTAVPHEAAPRDELAIKLNLALSLREVDVAQLIGAQRVESMRTLQSYTRLKAASDAAELSWQLTLDLMIFHSEAELRWLDHCEQSLAIHGRAASAEAPARASQNKGVKVR
jgi:DNA-binding PadR family transcriptional regulator